MKVIPKDQQLILNKLIVKIIDTFEGVSFRTIFEEHEKMSTRYSGG